MPEKLYKMGDVAKLHNITKKTLRYYDKIDLFKPDQIGGLNNYKYYSRKNFPILKQIIYLKDIGFSLSETKYLLENRTHELMISELHKRLNIVSEDIDKLSQKKRSIEYLINFYERAKKINKNDLNRPSIQIHDTRKVFMLDAEQNDKEGIMLAYRKVLGRLRELDHFSHQEYGSIYFNNGEQLPKRSGSFILLPTDFKIQGQNILPRGKYISMYHMGSYYNEKAVTFLMDWLNNNNYKAIGDFYDFCIVDRSFTDNEDEMIMELQVLVE
ncbi:MerR family transcriptional regulator [Thiospirochaeta perfilievii]|uniref:MerR family transcriptional regulator n=1 Tax=Thiospirochaeta perfilievii TaxID=252967 RepID=A0A5C1Q6H5_9SPIO|nr:MerR family transcriptional regulator [Thiospirochaeta perfilievii]QEN03673.1 MerR family transcriptional regulator [Thiospirochaeta perfilievii]